MGKKGFVNWLAAAVGALALTFLLGTPVQAQTVTVAAGGDIQAALDKAKGASEETTVTLAAGEYKVSRFLLIYSNTTLNAEGATIRNNANGPLITADSLQNVTINGGTWISDTGSVVSLENGGKNVTLKNMALSGNTSCQLAVLKKFESSAVKNCSFTGGNSIALEADNNTGLTISGNTIKDSGWSAIYLGNDDGSVVDGNTVSGSAAVKKDSSQGEGIVVADSSNTVIKNNTVSDVHDWFENYGNGILISTSEDVVVDGNTVTNAANHGIQVSYNAKNVTLSNNKIVSPDRMGISVSRGSNANLKGNKITGAKVNGIVFDGYNNKDYGACSGSIESCTVENSGNCDVSIDNSVVTLKNSTLKDCNGEISITVNNTSTLTASNNWIYQSGGQANKGGIMISEGCTATLSENRICDFGLYGIMAAKDSTVSGEKNQVSVSTKEFSNANVPAYYIWTGTSQTITENKLWFNSLSATTFEAGNYIADCEAGAVVDGQTYETKANAGGDFTVAYPSTSTSNVIAYVKDANGNAVCIQAPVTFSLYGASATTNTEVDEEQVRAFVSRIYTVALGRDAETEGLEYWTNKLVTGESNGAAVAQGFFFSAEMNAKNLTDEEFVDTLYATMFDREGDEGGKAGWLEDLATGFSREYVYHGFAESQEFQNLCDEFGITRGSVTLGQARDQNEGVTKFVSRIYFKALNRTELDEDGLNDWCGRILNGTSPADVVFGFVFSQEFTNRKLDDDAFVRTMYETYFDREADDAGYQDWMNRLANGATREDVVEGFSGSLEFFNLVESFGLSN